MNGNYIIRDAALQDAPAILEIYTPYILKTAITFEYDVPTLAEFEDRMRDIMGDYPYLVCEQDGRVVGYAYAHRYFSRAAYDWDAELSVYLDETCTGKGIGTKLYRELMERLKRQNIKNVYALVTHPNEASEALHRSLGFRLIGISEKTGYKLGKWWDLAYFEKEIGGKEGVPEPVIRYDCI